MQDQPGDVDSRPPGGALETMQTNTNEVEALRVTNQHLLKELEQLTRKIRRPQETRQPEKTKTLLLEKSNTPKRPKPCRGAALPPSGKVQNTVDRDVRWNKRPHRRAELLKRVLAPRSPIAQFAQEGLTAPDPSSSPCKA